MESIAREKNFNPIALKAFFFVVAFYVVAAVALVKEAGSLHGNAAAPVTAAATLNR